jgi:hypothetical protein
LLGAASESGSEKKPCKLSPGTHTAAFSLAVALLRAENAAKKDRLINIVKKTE